MDDPVEQFLTLLVVIGLGMAVGRISLRDVSLGSGGVLFVGLLAGELGFEVPKFASTVGVVLFVYCLGIGAGPTFFRMLVAHGRALILLAVVMILSAAAAAWAVARVLGLEPDLAGGMLAGALTSTPAFAAAAERMPPDSDVALGFGVAYPVGVVGVILFVQLASRRVRRKLAADTAQGKATGERSEIERVIVDVVNPAVVGRRLRDIGPLAHANCQISRVKTGSTMSPIPADFTLRLNQQLLLTGESSCIGDVVDALGRRSEETDYVLDVERQRRRVVVTSKEVVGRSLADLHLLSRFGVTVVRIQRHDVEFVPRPQERVQFADALTVVGDPESLRRFTELAGHRERTIDETDLISLVAGLALGVVVGQLRLNWGSTAVSLGMAGGPLLVGLVLGHFGRVGPLVGHMPRAARLLLSEVGLALFLAAAGVQAGSNLLPMLRQQGVAVLLGSFVILCVPLLVGYLLAHWALALKPLEVLGGMCGAMTSTPALGLVSSSFDSSLPATSYATVYPLALIVVTIVAPLLLELL